MDTPESIERALLRLVPSALSEEGRSFLEETIDELAAASGPASRSYGEASAVAGVRKVLLGWFALGMAASLALVIGLWQLGTGERSVGNDVLFVAGPAMVLIEESSKILSAEEKQGLLADSDGSIHRAWWVEVVNEERFLDPQTGSEVRVVEPRDEMILMPVTAF